ncbi:MAG TPA: hypothetical protein PLV45_10270, partial [bacterium]|nr:hypothetical protein [bacterium]
DFLKMQRKAKDLIHQKLGVPPTIRAMTWIARSAEIKAAYEVDPFAKTFYIHGMGVQIVTDDINIDFDYSLNGYEDGFDDWRIFMFIVGGDSSKWDPEVHLYKAIGQWFEDLESKGLIQMRDNLFYLQNQGLDIVS